MICTSCGISALHRAVGHDDRAVSFIDVRHQIASESIIAAAVLKIPTLALFCSPKPTAYDPTPTGVIISRAMPVSARVTAGPVLPTALRSRTSPGPLASSRGRLPPVRDKRATGHSFLHHPGHETRAACACRAAGSGCSNVLFVISSGSSTHSRAICAKGFPTASMSASCCSTTLPPEYFIPVRGGRSSRTGGCSTAGRHPGSAAAWAAVRLERIRGIQSHRPFRRCDS